GAGELSTPCHGQTVDNLGPADPARVKKNSVAMLNSRPAERLTAGPIERVQSGLKFPLTYTRCGVIFVNAPLGSVSDGKSGIQWPPPGQTVRRLHFRPGWVHIAAEP